MFHFNVLVVSWKGKTVTRKALHPLNDCRHWVDRGGLYKGKWLKVCDRGSLLKEVAVHGVLYQSILNAKLTGRNKLSRKMCTSNRDDRKLENTVKHKRFKHLGELHKVWTKARVSASRVTTLRHLQEKGYQATSETETSPEASYLG